MNTNYYAILMAGGVGSRFWPMSTADFPKQFHDMLGTGQTLLQKTFCRLTKLIPSENILILTNEKYKKIVLNQLNISSDQVVLEPTMRNTAPCILYASLKIEKSNPDAQVLIVPSDHWIEDENLFLEHILQAFDFCENNNALLTLGIKPTHPNTGYGYIQYDKSEPEPIKKVKRFCEKPDLKTAQHFINSENFLWNAGIFVWSVQSVLSSFEKHQPEMYDLFKRGYQSYNTPQEIEFIRENFAKSENISIDYALLEKSENIYVLPSIFDWSDLGTWSSLYEKLPKNKDKNAIIGAKVIAEQAQNNIIRTQNNKQVVLRGLSDFIIVETTNTLLIYPKSNQQDIKKIVQNNDL